MAGKAYTLQRPGLDPVAAGAGADNVGYAAGLRPRARYQQSNASATWRGASDSVTHQVHCNIRPRISTAPALDVAQARALQVNPFVPGRRPAPRLEIGCGEAPSELMVPSGALARDLSFRAPQKSPANPDGGRPAGPGPNPPGVGPLPPPPDPVAPVPPMLPAPPVPPVVVPPSPPPVVPVACNASARVPGTLQTINFHLTGDIAAGAAASEVRVHGPIGAPFIIQQIWINADSGVAPGQFLDVLISNDGDVSDVAGPSGQSIFPVLNGTAFLPAPDEQRGVAIPASLQELKLAFRVDNVNSWIKVQSLFVAPAIALPNVHVTMCIERLDGLCMVSPPIQPRPPLDDPMAPPVVPSPPPAEPPIVGAVFVPDATQTQYAAPAWRVAAQGLGFSGTRGVRSTYPNQESYAAWLLDAASPAAALFRARIEKVLSAASVTGGSPNTYVDLSLTLPASG